LIEIFLLYHYCYLVLICMTNNIQVKRIVSLSSLLFPLSSLSPLPSLSSSLLSLPLSSLSPLSALLTLSYSSLLYFISSRYTLFSLPLPILSSPILLFFSSPYRTFLVAYQGHLVQITTHFIFHSLLVESSQFCERYSAVPCHSCLRLRESVRE
jgi:hypothetical protein